MRLRAAPLHNRSAQGTPGSTVPVALRHQHTASRLLSRGQGAAVAAFLARLDACVSGEAAFTLRLDDPAGNRYVEAGPGSVDGDELLSLERYERTREQARRPPGSAL